MSSYSFVQHDPASRAGGVGGGGGDGVGGVRASQSTTAAETGPGLAVDAGRVSGGIRSNLTTVIFSVAPMIVPEKLCFGEYTWVGSFYCR